MSFCGVVFYIVRSNGEMGTVQERGNGNVKRQLAEVFERSLRATVPSEVDVEPIITVGTGNFGDYQW